MENPYQIYEAKIIERIKESDDIFTIKILLTDPFVHHEYKFQPGQFNMLYLFGVGEIAISIVSDPKEEQYITHTIRVVGRVSRGFEKLKEGDRIGVRGPFGKGWPLKQAIGKDVLIISGGLGCAPVTSAINYIIERQNLYGPLKILQGIKRSSEFIYHERYDRWEAAANTEVIISVDETDVSWSKSIGLVTEHIKDLQLDVNKTIVMMCGPEIMMKIAADHCIKKNIEEKNIYLSMERNMHCGCGHCGHCQIGGVFVCKNGPVFSYPEIKELLGRPGF
ncbi:MAG: FAD/NAD(P)-binding protein [Oligoflexia bacterium]|nr:FAD/NAD(P)-binding protein [Oligoflexia bacterium]